MRTYGYALARSAFYGKTISTMDQQEKSSLPASLALKICGLKRLADVEYCWQRGVPYVGFNFYSGSKRFITPAVAAALWSQLEAMHGDLLPTQPVAIVVDAEPADLAEILKVFPAIAVVQCHGRESVATCKAYRSILGGRALWKALPVSRTEDMTRAEAYLTVADLLLFDAATVPSGSSVPGGSGESFDWQLLHRYRGPLPFGVAGGLKAANIEDLVRIVRPSLLDLCSGVESEPGVKDKAQIDAVLNALAPYLASGR